MTVVSVITPTILGREAFLAECKLSVQCQTFLVGENYGKEVLEHMIVSDPERNGCSQTTNTAADLAKGKWLLPLADDDLLLPGAIDALLAASDDADVVYSPPLVTGNEDRWWFFQEPPCIPSTALIRRDLWMSFGGYDETLNHEEDRDLWTKILEAGYKFVRVDEPVWVYRMHAANKSFNKQVVAA